MSKEQSEEERLLVLIKKVLDTQKSMKTNNDENKATSAHYLKQLRTLELQMKMFREEETGILGAFPKFSAIILTTILAMAEPRQGILNLAKNYGKKQYPTTLIAAGIALLALTYYISTQPDIMAGIGIFFANRDNQIFVVIISLIIGIIGYMYLSRKRRIIK